MEATEARTAGILLEMQAGTAQVRTSTEGIPEHPGNIKRPSEPDGERIHDRTGRTQAVEDSNPQGLVVAPVAGELAAAEQPPVANLCSVSHTSTPIQARAANASAEALNGPQTPRQRSSASSVRSGTRDGRRKTFPAQNNTLLSWVKPVTRQPSEGGHTPQPAQASPSHSTPPPLPPSSSRSTSRLLQPSYSNSTPQPAAQGTPTAASPSPFVRPRNVPSPGVA